MIALGGHGVSSPDRGARHGLRRGPRSNALRCMSAAFVSAAAVLVTALLSGRGTSQGSALSWAVIGAAPGFGATVQRTGAAAWEGSRSRSSVQREIGPVWKELAGGNIEAYRALAKAQDDLPPAEAEAQALVANGSEANYLVLGLFAAIALLGLVMAFQILRLLFDPELDGPRMLEKANPPKETGPALPVTGPASLLED
ncbi:unnamed protein product [Polarella glacialis]|uniref:Uncharacterized protein n=1 Tax=Polarella glacialis TaxID=89957 RepID=A0A813GGF6_POLGL|nr:unnamed protein product [Polarella glacialis]CAE8736287.1 unnamed protein product [Polarella glacialis]